MAASILFKIKWSRANLSKRHYINYSCSQSCNLPSNHQQDAFHFLECMYTSKPHNFITFLTCKCKFTGCLKTEKRYFLRLNKKFRITPCWCMHRSTKAPTVYLALQIFIIVGYNIESRSHSKAEKCSFFKSITRSKVKPEKRLNKMFAVAFAKKFIRNFESDHFVNPK